MGDSGVEQDMGASADKQSRITENIVVEEFLRNWQKTKEMKIVFGGCRI